MKKLMKAFFCVLMILVLSACSQEKISIPSSEIAPIELTENEKALLDLVGFDESNISIFEYTGDDQLKSVTFWLEAYHNGVKEDLVTSNELIERQGKIAIKVDTTDKFEWMITIQDKKGSSRSTYNLDGQKPSTKEQDFSMSSTKLAERVEIKPDQEIVLAVHILETGNSVSVYSPQYYVESPETLKEYDHIYLLKCKFSSNELE
ncbi:hypothetical protein [Brevibacillus daliensis]|uniref:hypothetical protein n=1 Tax=Brevibacillus daliensis TaxID=2892995 RepID=UPI001E2A11B8|nr:hypothetical protein [Brevibacillus daliensis]